MPASPGLGSNKRVEEKSPAEADQISLDPAHPRRRGPDGGM